MWLRQLWDDVCAFLPSPRNKSFWDSSSYKQKDTNQKERKKQKKNSVGEKIWWSFFRIAALSGKTFSEVGCQSANLQDWTTNTRLDN